VESPPDNRRIESLKWSNLDILRITLMPPKIQAEAHTLFLSKLKVKIENTFSLLEGTQDALLRSVLQTVCFGLPSIYHYHL
jgi:hypothetical protein